MLTELSIENGSTNRSATIAQSIQTIRLGAFFSSIRRRTTAIISQFAMRLILTVSLKENSFHVHPSAFSIICRTSSRSASVRERFLVKAARNAGKEP